MKRIWIVVALMLFAAGGLVVAVALGGGPSHPKGQITVASATPPGTSIRLLDSESCHPDFPGWRGSGKTDDTDAALDWFELEWGPTIEPWTSRSNGVGAVGVWRHYGDISVWVLGDSSFVVQTFETVDHSCPDQGAEPWGGEPDSTWSRAFAGCEGKTDVWFGGLRYGEKTDAFGRATPPTAGSPRGWDQVDFPNGGSISYVTDPSEIAVRLPGTTLYQRYSLGGCPQV